MDCLGEEDAEVRATLIGRPRVRFDMYRSADTKELNTPSLSLSLSLSLSRSLSFLFPSHALTSLAIRD